MKIWGVSWEYFLLFMAISVFVGYLLDIVITTQARRMPVFFRVGKINIFGALLLPIITVVSIYTRENIPEDYLPIVSTSIYFGAAALFVYYAFKSKEQRHTQNFYLSVLLAGVFLVLGFFSR